MALIGSPTISVNVKNIDDQHKKLFEILNQVLLMQALGAQDYEMLEEFKELVNYSDDHFRPEDTYRMSTAG